MSHRHMRFTLLLLPVAAALGQSEVSNPNRTTGDAAAGARIFRSHCAQCHGANGAGGLGPNLTTGVFYHGGTDADLYRNITEGIAGTAMPGSFFDGVQAWQIVAYVRSINQTAGVASEAPPQGEVRRGETLFHEKGCAGCHLVRGEGGLRGPDLSLIGAQRSVEYLTEAVVDPNAKVSRKYWVAKITLHNGPSYSGFVMNEDTHFIQILDFSQGLRSLPKNEFASFEINKKSIMPPYKGKLNGQELNDLVAFLWSLRRQGGVE